MPLCNPDKRLRLIVMAVASLLSAPAFASPALMLDAVSFQAGPDKSDDSLGKLRTGDRVDVVWCATRGQCLVQSHNKLGWVPLASLNLKPGRKRSAADQFGGGGSSSGSGGGGGGAGGSAGGNGPASNTAPENAVMAPMPPKGGSPMSEYHPPAINFN